MIFIPIEELGGKARNAVIDFLIKNESTCVQLTSNIRKNSYNSFAVFVNDISASELYGVIQLRKTILHCLPFVRADSESALQEDFVASFAAFFREGKFEQPVCINGVKDGTDLLLKCFDGMGNRPAQVNSYNLLRLQSKEFVHSCKNSRSRDYTIIRCRKDIPVKLKNQLINLQENYEIEEVVPACFSFDADSCRLRLCNSLRTQCILALVDKDGRVLAKAGTNAIGFKNVQIGGVFTQKDFRGKGLCKMLVTVLLLKILKMKRTPVLFVKVENEVANKLYNSLHFIKLSSYSIAYFTLN